MKLSCGVTIVNRFATNLGIKCNQKFKNAVLAVMKPPKEDAIFLLLVTSKNTAGTRYKIRGNVEKVFSQFRHEGKTTIRFHEPPHDLMINADKIQLANFLVFLKKVNSNDVKNIPNVSKISVPLVKKPSISKLEINTSSEYPTLQGFPSNLQILTINNCHLKRVDSRIMKLKNLTILSLDKNNLTEIPFQLNKLPLKHLSLSNNKLGRNYQSWNFLSWPLSECLEYLNLSGNEMKYFPASLARFHKLKTLKLCNISVNKIPFRILLLPSLQDLDLSKNFLLALPGTITKRFKKLNTLDISDNELPSASAHPNQGQINLNQVPKEYVPSLLELSTRSIVENRIFYGESTLPCHLIPLLDHVVLCVCGKICAKSFGSIYKTADIKELANTFISSNRFYTVPTVYNACCPKHLGL